MAHGKQLPMEGGELVLMDSPNHLAWPMGTRQGAKLLMRPLALILWPDLPVGSLASLCPLDLELWPNRIDAFLSSRSQWGPGPGVLLVVFEKLDLGNICKSG